MPRFSIVMPVYNAEGYIEASLDALFSQTFTDIEVIAVNDASTDGSGTILDRYAAKDARLKVIHHQKNTYTGQSRKDGVLCSQGDYILFVDQDDGLASDACEKLASLVENHPADIIHFGTKGVISDDVDENYQKELDSFLSPYVGELVGRDILEGCFFDRKYSWNVWNKLYRADLCKKAHEHVDMANVRYGEDFYAYFIIAFYANSYYGINDEMYTYHYGLGQTGHSRVDIGSFRFICTASVVVDEIERFVHVQAVSQGKILTEKARSLLIWEPACMLKSNVAICSKSEALHVFFAAWGLDASISVLRKLYKGEEALLAYELHVGGGLSNGSWVRSDAIGEKTLVLNDESEAIWKVLKAKYQGYLCRITAPFSLYDAVSTLDTRRLLLMFPLCLCDLLMVENCREASLWNALGAHALVLGSEHSGCAESKPLLPLTCDNAKDGDRFGPDAFASCKFLHEWLIEVKENRQLKMKLELLAEDNKRLELYLERATKELEVVMRSTIWKVGYALTWVPRKLRDSLRSSCSR